ncbi:MAG: autotransporter outer membrane beta-barrel domain-containing protein [Proteobacteria bacterium]|nr:autotransporter outer membrane beta-barrel domain-containing protein [Pseudomonadota bacterium]MBU1739603.1 autotransporter outer membrane beta-barrel domain-containing protein [Pseudomonadota bacterium]
MKKNGFILLLLGFVVFLSMPAFGADYVQSIAVGGTYDVIFHNCGSGTLNGYLTNVADNTIAPLHGTFSDGGAGTLSPARELADCGTATGVVPTEIVRYTADPGYNGADTFQFFNSFTAAFDNYSLTIGTPPAPPAITGNSASSVVSGGKNLISSVNFLTKFISIRTVSIFRRSASRAARGLEASLAGSRNKSTPSPAADSPPKDLFDDRIKLSISQNQLGISAGDQIDRQGIWGNLGYTSTGDRNLVTESDSDLYTMVAGYDYMFTENFAAGTALTYENIDENSRYNLGSLQTDGYSLAPYLTWQVSDAFSFDLIAGYTYVSYEQDRLSGTITSSLNAQRYFMQSTINNFYYLNNWTFVANVAYLHAHEKQEGFTESDNTVVPGNAIDIAQFTAGVEVAYGFTHAEPYFLLGFEYDTKYDEIAGLDYDRTGGDIGCGVRMNFLETLTVDLSGSSKFGRSNIDEYSLQGNLRYAF